MHPFSYIVWVRFFCHKEHFLSYAVWFRFLWPQSFLKGAIFFNCLAPFFWQQSFYKLHFLVLHCGSIFFRHSHVYRVPFFVFNWLVPIFLVTVTFIRRIFFPTLFGLDFLGHCHFCKVPFFATVWLRFFGNSHFINCIFLSCTVAQFFFRHSHFYRVPFFIFNCLAPIFLATVIFI